MNYPSHDRIEGGRFTSVKSRADAHLYQSPLHKAIAKHWNYIIFGYWLPAEPAPWLHPVQSGPPPSHPNDLACN